MKKNGPPNRWGKPPNGWEQRGFFRGRRGSGRAGEPRGGIAGEKGSGGGTRAPGQGRTERSGAIKRALLVFGWWSARVVSGTGTSPQVLRGAGEKVPGGPFVSAKGPTTQTLGPVSLPRTPGGKLGRGGQRQPPGGAGGPTEKEGSARGGSLKALWGPPGGPPRRRGGRARTPPANPRGLPRARSGGGPPSYPTRWTKKAENTGSVVVG